MTPSHEPQDHAMLIDGEDVNTGEWIEVLSPYDQSVVGRAAKGDASHVDQACAAAQRAFDEGLPAHERAAILDRAAAIVAEREDELATVIAAEAGKPMKTARGEAQRCVSTLTFSAVEARKLAGHQVPMEASAAGEGKFGFTLRVPFGVVGAVSPFNFPLNLVAHKLGPVLAAGNSVVLKPASKTPLSALILARIFEEAGAPAGWLNVVCGGGSDVGQAIIDHESTRVITFTGSSDVGWGMVADAPQKKFNLELGSNAPLIVDADGDWETAADKAKIHAFSHAGQSCISIQRILLHTDIAEQFTERFVSNIESLKVGDPMSEETDVGPLISPDERDRVKEWIDQAKAAGAEILTGGELVDEDRCLAPTVIRNPDRDQKVWCEEIFGPAATISTFDSLDEAIELANDSRYGLNAGVFTATVAGALKAAEGLEFGAVLINEVPTYRADQMPYGGVKDSGNTREGPSYAVQELTEERFISFQG